MSRQRRFGKSDDNNARRSTPVTASRRPIICACEPIGGTSHCPPEANPVIRIKRCYEPRERGDGRRILVERLWPRGMKKADLHADAWLKEVAPSTELRQWFGHEVERWGEFKRRYRKELNGNRDAWAPILDASERGTVTLIYSARDVEHNGARVLRDYLTKQQHRRPTSRAVPAQHSKNSRRE